MTGPAVREIEARFERSCGRSVPLESGKVFIASADKTSFAGTILALGGKRFGDGGFAAITSHGVLQFTGSYYTLFAAASFMYVIGLLIIQVLVPRIQARESLGVR